MADRKPLTLIEGIPQGLPSGDTVAKADVGLGNVDNTSDVNKPVSIEQKTYLATRKPCYALGRPSVLNLASTDADLKGFHGGFTDGRYGYFVPYNNGASFGKVARVDLNDFSSVTVLNLASTDADLKGFVGGFTDGRYGYFVPYNNGASFGKVARIPMFFGGNL